MLSKYLEYKYRTLRGKKILELGCGTGFVGICAGLLDAEVVHLTDLEYAIENINHNIKLNNQYIKGEVSSFILDWYEVK